MSSHMSVAIRSATESETFDLAGSSASTIETTVRSAFSEPLELQEMIRITFVTGAGKLARQRYDEDAARILTSTLRDLGYVEDRGASCVNECAGSFKLQHDTGKNLKTVVVFPLIKASLKGAMDDLTLKEKKGPSILDEKSPKGLLAMSSMNTFERMISVKCPSWSQKKACLNVMEEIKEIVQSLDDKVLKGSPLTESEQEFYDACDLTSLEKKETFIKNAMHKHVEEGQITSLEKKRLLDQVKEKVDSLQEEIKDATENNKPKKLLKLQAQLEKMKERQTTLNNIHQPCPPFPLKHQPEIEKLRKELHPLIKLEQETKGRLLSIKETAAMTRKQEIEEEILQLENDSRGWFEDDQDFQHRVEASRLQAKYKAAASTKIKKVSKAGGSTSSNTSGGGKKTTITNWVVPGANRNGSKAGGAKKSSSSKTTRTNAFAAMMMDSDSDSD